MPILATQQVNIITGGTRGLMRDAHVLANVLREHWPTQMHFSRQRNLHLLHKRIICSALGVISRHEPISIFSEILPTPWLRLSKKTVFIPNQEWIRPEVEANLKHCKLVLCKTHYCKNIFSERGIAAQYIGFSTEDAYDPSVKKDYSKAIHIAGRSHLKGTRAIIQAWNSHPEWPALKIITTHPEFSKIAVGKNIEVFVGDMSDADIKYEMNSAGIHLCPSETEGFGHYIAEALSTKALVITTNAPPMNELVASDYGLLADYSKAERMSWSERFLVDPDALAVAIESAFAMSVEEKQARGDRARNAFLQKRSTFEGNVVAAIQSLTLQST